ncbi:MAG: O-antigen ligase family protein, partial [Verrucomicrobiota bacterium]
MNFLPLRWCDAVAGGSVLAVTILGPWALGGFMPWTVVMLQGLALTGALATLAGGIVRWRIQPPPATRIPHSFRQGGVVVLAAILATYVILSAVNARAVSRLATYGVEFDYRDAWRWLPHSFDRGRTFEALGQWLAAGALGWVFLAWIRADPVDNREIRESGRLPRRLRIWIWTLAASSGVLALAGLSQKLRGDEWLFTRFEWMLLGKKWSGAGGFATYPYQANAAQYFNLAWPLILGSWWVEWRTECGRRGVRSRIGHSPMDLLPALGLPALACPFAAGSRGGMLIAMLQVLALIAILLRRQHSPGPLRPLVLGVMLGALALAAWAGWSQGWDRFGSILTDNGSGRLKTWALVRGMIPDFDPWGSGLGTFSMVVQPYWPDPFGDWEALVHNDWLEFRLELGWVGGSLLGWLGLAWIRRWIRGPWLPVSRDYSAFAGVAMLG